MIHLRHALAAAAAALAIAGCSQAPPEPDPTISTDNIANFQEMVRFENFTLGFFAFDTIVIRDQAGRSFIYDEAARSTEGPYGTVLIREGFSLTAEPQNQEFAYTADGGVACRPTFDEAKQVLVPITEPDPIAVFIDQNVPFDAANIPAVTYNLTTCEELVELTLATLSLINLDDGKTVLVDDNATDMFIPTDLTTGEEGEPQTVYYEPSPDGSLQVSAYTGYEEDREVTIRNATTGEEETLSIQATARAWAPTSEQIFLRQEFLDQLLYDIDTGETLELPGYSSILPAPDGTYTALFPVTPPDTPIAVVDVADLAIIWQSSDPGFIPQNWANEEVLGIANRRDAIVRLVNVASGDVLAEYEGANFVTFNTLGGRDRMMLSFENEVILYRIVADGG